MGRVGDTRALQVLNMSKQGYEIPKIANLLGVSESSVRRYLRHGKSLELEPKKKEGAKILFFDIETSPALGYFFSIWKQNIGIKQIVKDWAMLSWSAKWLGSDEIISDVVSPQEAFDHTDLSITKSLIDVINQADIVIAHNAKGFDIKKVNSRILINKLKPTMPVQVVDTLIESRKNFAHLSHKLDWCAKIIDAQQKDPTDFTLWSQCCGDEGIEKQIEALAYMEKYNRTDIRALEDVYLAIRPFIKSHPNLGLYYDGEYQRCPNCGSPNLDWGGHYFTTVGRFMTFRCMSCGAVGRSRKSDLSKAERQQLVSPIAR